MIAMLDTGSMVKQCFWVISANNHAINAVVAEEEEEEAIVARINPQQFVAVMGQGIAVFEPW